MRLAASSPGRTRRGGSASASSSSPISCSRGTSSTPSSICATEPSMPLPKGLHRINVSARLLLKDLLRRRITLLLLLIVPALFDAVVLATTTARTVDVTLGTLVEEGA